jgi:hypothetical protein
MNDTYLYEAICVGDGTWMVKRYPDRTNFSDYEESLFRDQRKDITDGEVIALGVLRGSWA